MIKRVDELIPYASVIGQLRYQPRIIKSLEHMITEDRDKLLAIRKLLLNENTKMLRRREQQIMKRIDRNSEMLNTIKLDNLKLRNKIEIKLEER
jgi:hypothetical protein